MATSLGTRLNFRWSITRFRRLKIQDFSVVRARQLSRKTHLFFRPPPEAILPFWTYPLSEVFHFMKSAMKRLQLRTRPLSQLPVLALLFSLTFMAQVTRASDPSIPWAALETAHFKLIYDSRHYPLASAYARSAEEAFVTTAPTFGEWPDKTVIVLNEYTDEANGNATCFPYPIIQVYPVLPTATDSIGDYGNWGTELLTHEYSHILTFQPVHGIMAPFATIFGSVVRPNLLLPTWYLEGLAVEMETRHSEYGRLRSANYLSIPRAMIEDGTLEKENIGRINELSIPGWPGGIRPYLFGALMWNEIVNQGGEEAIGKLNQAHSRRFPFFINGPAEELLHKNYSEILGDTFNHLRLHSLTQIDAIHAAGSLPHSEFDQAGHFSVSPSVSPDAKKLAWVETLDNGESAIEFATRDDVKNSFLLSTHKNILSEMRSVTRVSWLKNSKAFVFDSIDQFRAYKRYYEFSDLYLYEVAKDSYRQLTMGARAREPMVSPDDKFIVFVQNTDLGTQLSAYNTQTKEIAVVYHESPQVRVSFPEFLSRDELVFSERTVDGLETLKRLHLRVNGSHLEGDGAATVILSQFKPAHFPRMSARGLLFVSDKSGVANVYLANAQLTDAKPVTNITTRALTAELDSSTGELLFSRLSSKGPRLVSVVQENWEKAPSKLPQVGPMVDTEWPKFERPSVEVEIKKEEYSSLGYMLPRYWLPYFWIVPNGSYFSASTSAVDPVAHHSYALTAAYDTLTRHPSFSGQYLNQDTRLSLLFAGTDLWEYIYSGNYPRHSTYGDIRGSFFIPGFSDAWKGLVGWEYAQSQAQGSTNAIRGGPQVGIQYSDVTEAGYQISPEKGGMFSLINTAYLPSLGNASYNKTDISGTAYFSKSLHLPKRHVFVLSSTASVAQNMPRIRLIGTTTVGGTYQTNVVAAGLLMRGYQSGVFLGKNLLTSTAEYRFPISDTYRGFGSFPAFLSRWSADVFVDSLTEDGYAYDSKASQYQRESLGKFYMGSGAEMKADTNLLFHIPVQFVFGLYYGFNKYANPNGLFPFVGLNL